MNLCARCRRSPHCLYKQADRATDFRHPHGLHHHVSALSSSNILKTEQQQGVDDKENEEQEEEAEIAMCLWVDQPGSGAGDDLVTKGRARAVLQEVRSRVSHLRCLQGSFTKVGAKEWLS